MKLVSPARAQALAGLGVRTVRDLLTHFPRRYIDLSKRETVAGQKIRDLVTATTSEARYAMTKLPALLTRLGSEVVTSVGSGTTASLNVEWTPNKITIALSKLTDSATSLTDAPPTWGLVYLFPYTANANANSWEATMLAYFTVGSDLNADLMIPEGVIPKGTPWKSPDDLVLDVSGGIQ